MEEKKIRLLRADEIECRIGTVSEKGASLLLYKDARADMRILDETFGPMGWQRRHELVGGNLYCAISVWDEDKQQWISKMDVGTESNTEKEKGQASDSFKRACVSLGIGRELYTAPFIWIAAAKLRMEEYKGKLVVRDRFKVSQIAYGENREITGLTIINQDGRVLYHLEDNRAGGNELTVSATGNTSAKKGSVKTDSGQGNLTIQEKPEVLTGEVISAKNTEDLNRELVRTGVALDAVLRRYGITDIGQMDTVIYRKAMNSLRRTKSKAA